MHFTSENRLGEVVERKFTMDQIPGVLWTPVSVSAPVPLILLGHPGGLGQMHARLSGRALRFARSGFATAAVELPGSGERPPLPGVQQARADLRQSISSGTAPSAGIVDRLVLPLVDQAVPEWQRTLDAVLALREIGGPVGVSGGVIAIGVRLAVVEPRLSAASFFAGSFVPAATLEEATRITIPLHVLLQWDDENNDRQSALDLFDAFGSKEKTLYANTGGHTGVPEFAGDDAATFFARHLR
jgi:dienelactone hydrolase